MASSNAIAAPLEDTAAGWFHHAAALVAAHDYHAAIAAYRRGADDAKDPVAASLCCMNLAWALLETQQFDDAMRASWRAIALDPTNASFLQIHARALRLGGKTEDAITFYAATIESDAAYRRHWADIALLRAAQGRYLDGLDVIRAHLTDFAPHSLEYKMMLEAADICLTALDNPSAPIAGAFGCPSRAATAEQWQALYEDTPGFRRFAPVFCVGDSHAAFFSGTHSFQYFWPEPSPQRLPHISGYYLASALAFSLNRPNASERGLEKLQAFLRSDHLVRGASVMLSFGEIDLRNHVIAQSIEQSRPVAKIVADCVAGYRHAIELVLAAGHRALIWAPPPSRSDSGAYQNMFPTTGTEQQRNAATRLFIDQLRDATAESRTPVISIFDEMIDADMRSDTRYFMDSCHLNMSATPFAVRAFRREMDRLNLN